MEFGSLNPSRATVEGFPEWLCSQRVGAAQRLAAAERPDPTLEEWRYSEIDRLDPESLDTGPRPVPGTGNEHLDRAAMRSTLLGEAAGRILSVDGRVGSVHLDAVVAARGVRFGLLADEPQPVGGHHVEVTVGSSEATSSVDPFSLLNLAYGDDPLVLRVPRGEVVEHPLHVVHRVVGRDVLIAPRLVVEVGEQAEVHVVEWLAGPGDGSLVVPRHEIVLGRGARLKLVTVNVLGQGVDLLGETAFDVGQEATVQHHHIALGGRYARTRVDCRLTGRGAGAKLSALYVGDEHQMHDLRTFQTHEAPDTTSELRFKGVLDDAAHAVYTGTIRVDPEGRGSNAEQSNRVIKLSPDTWAESVPNLEIHHNDVRCAHATAVGPIDADQRFYLESRGVDPATAERLVVNGFFEDVVSGIDLGNVATEIAPLIAAKLGAGS
ncbi:MAG: Fe-S cluster assembly protein SufD [Microthrixaceae bacterium]